MIVHYHDSASRASHRRYRARVRLNAPPSLVRATYRDARRFAVASDARMITLGIYGTPLIYGRGE